MGALRQDPDAGLEARRRKILDAAKVVFATHGGMSAGLRAIATRAGCTTGAIYAVFSNKEDIYAALLEKSLVELSQRVAAAAGKEASPEAALRRAMFEFFTYYQEHRFEYHLGLYLFERNGQLGLGADRDRRLNALLLESIQVFAVCFERLKTSGRRPDTDPGALAHALFASLLGAALVALTRRDISIGTEAEQILETILRQFLKP